MSPKQFIFEDYFFDIEAKSATFKYSYDSQKYFEEIYSFDFELIEYDQLALDRALQVLFFISGISYYKAFLVEEIVIKKGQIDKNLAALLNKTYKKGLGELLYKNDLDPNIKINFPVNSETLKQTVISSSGDLVSIGGGKDSLLSFEILKNSEKIATWSVGHKNQLSPLVEKIGSKHLWVERKIDTGLIQLNQFPGVFNGHIPISAIFAATGTVISILSGFQNSIVSNEQSANEATLEYRGESINHQYSKTSEFEADYQKISDLLYGDSVRYFSLLRPLREIMIAKEFSKKYIDKYYSTFSSCNRAFTQKSDRIFWCGECAKCAATYLLFAPFNSEEKLINLYGKNLLLEEKLKQTYLDLLGISGQKPLECVGEIAENRWAMSQMKKVYNELNTYTYEEASYKQVWNVSDHLIPEDFFIKHNLSALFKEI